MKAQLWDTEWYLAHRALIPFLLYCMKFSIFTRRAMPVKGRVNQISFEGRLVPKSFILHIKAQIWDTRCWPAPWELFLLQHFMMYFLLSCQMSDHFSKWLLFTISLFLSIKLNFEFTFICILTVIWIVNLALNSICYSNSKKRIVLSLFTNSYI